VKPAPFAYVAPASLDEALERLSSSDGAKILAGGQSLMPIMNLRLASFDELIDLGAVEGLAYIEPDDGGVLIGAMTRQRVAERSAALAERVPLLHEALAYVGHPATRVRGTVGGSIVHADPAAEIGTVLVALDGRLRVRKAGGRERWIGASELFTTYFTTTLEAHEIALAAWFPAAPPRGGAAFMEVARRSGDFALTSVAAQVVLDDGAIHDARIAIGGASATPWRAREAERLLGGADPDDRAAVRAAAEAARAGIQPRTDLHASPEYRRHVTGVLVERAVTLAAERALTAPQRSDP
jgi:carbon-monoxide dehydrogenase medium subunit